MNVRCPKCSRLYRVDPDRLGSRSVRARCADCAEVFLVEPPSGNGRSAAGAPTHAEAPAPAAAPAAGAAPGAPPAGAASPVRGGFGSPDPHTRAQRLARALVSDIVAYHRERRDESLAAGTLRGDFREEILKSWEEYVAQVGNDMARRTPFFRDALNDILASGQRVF